MAQQFSKEELLFVEDLPKHLVIECPVCLNILTDPHLVSCCGNNFCGFCIERVRASNGSCPMCKEKEYQSFVDKKCSRIINGLEVYCSNKEKGCQWKGELKNVSTHLYKEKREGECQYEKVKCRYEKCQERKQRKYLKDHEDDECPQRPFQCQYCGEEGTFLSITKDHYKECEEHPVTCPNKCSSTNMPRGSLTAHINECPLEPVDCVFSWAGCNDKPLHKDVHVHTADTKHMTLLAVACGQLKKENEQIKEESTKEIAIIKEENEKIKEENEKIKEEIKKDVEKLKKENTYLKYFIGSITADNPLLPINIREKSVAVHFYTGACGRHMSARIVETVWSRNEVMVSALLAFHEGKFDIFNPKLDKIFATYNDQHIPLIVDTEATYQELPHNVLNRVTRFDDARLPQGVIKIRLGTIPTYTIRKLKNVTFYTK